MASLLGRQMMRYNERIVGKDIEWFSKREKEKMQMRSEANR